MTLRSIVRVLGLLREASAQTSAAASSRPANKESTMTKVLVLYYSSHGHIEEMAYAAAEGIRSVGVEAIVNRVPETTPEEARKRGVRGKGVSGLLDVGGRRCITKKKKTY